MEDKVHKLPINKRNKQNMAQENKRKKKYVQQLVLKLNGNDRSRTIGGHLSSPTPNAPTDTTAQLRASHNEHSPLTDPSPPPESNHDMDYGPSGDPLLRGDDFILLKETLRERTIKKRAQAYLIPHELGISASLNTSLDERVPIFLSDIQHLILYSQQGGKSPYAPTRWCKLTRFNRLVNTSVIIIENISLEEFHGPNRKFFTFLDTFEHKFELLSAFTYKSDVVKEISMLPLTVSQFNWYRKKYGDIEVAVAKSAEVFDTTRNLFPKKSSTNSTNNDSDNPSVNPLPSSDRYPRTHLLLSGWQMVEENYPLPIRGLTERKFSDYVLTHDEYVEVTPFSKMFGVDCEMCITSTGDSELTQVTIVDEDMNVVYNTLVKPYNKIVNYLTRFSGITSKMMKTVKKRLEHVQADIRRLLPKDAILVGQSLSNDMHALKMMHPYVIDTSVIFNLTGDRTRKTGLKLLAQRFLCEDIQAGFGHSSIEDSKTALRLVQLKLTKDLSFGDVIMTGGVQDQIRTVDQQEDTISTGTYATSMLNHATCGNKTAFIVGLEDLGDQYQYFTNKGQDVSRENQKQRIMCVSKSNRDEVIEAICDSVQKYSLCIGHVRIEYCTSSWAQKLTLPPSTAPSDTFSKVDQWIKLIHDSLPWSSMMITIFTGTHMENGVCFIKLKNEF